MPPQRSKDFERVMTERNRPISPSRTSLLIRIFYHRSEDPEISVKYRMIEIYKEALVLHRVSLALPCCGNLVIQWNNTCVTGLRCKLVFTLYDYVGVIG